jgi:hypothetical protein
VDNNGNHELRVSFSASLPLQCQEWPTIAPVPRGRPSTPFRDCGEAATNGTSHHQIRQTITYHGRWLRWVGWYCFDFDRSVTESCENDGQQFCVAVTPSGIFDTP